MLTVCFITLVALSVVAVSADCSCSNQGTVNPVYANLCMCTCPSPYVPPTCSFTATDAIEMIIVIQNVSGTSYSSSLVTNTIADHYGLSRNDFVSKRRLTIEEPADLSQFHLLVDTVGSAVAPFLTDLSPVAAWLSTLNVVSARVYVQSQSSASTLAQSPFLFNVTAAGIPVTFQWASIAWGVGGLVMLLCLPLLEAIFNALCYAPQSQDDAVPLPVQHVNQFVHVMPRTADEDPASPTVMRPE